MALRSSSRWADNRDAWRVEIRVSTTPTTAWSVMDSPLGELRLTASEGALTVLEFSPFTRADIGRRRPTDPVLSSATIQLREYFAGKRKVFDLPLAPTGSVFQHEVWAELVQIEWGQTVSYGELARRLGRTNSAARAVGLANARNPIPVVIPCHRVIGTNGSLTGYAGGSARKQVLLDLESDPGQTLF